MSEHETAADAVKLIRTIGSLEVLKIVSGVVRQQWHQISNQSARAAAAELRIGDKVIIKRRGLEGIVVKFGPKNVMVQVSNPTGGATTWRCHPAFLEKA